ncbi:MAG: hypothetical protein WC529_06240 [Candidatus Margulisiibacteriota bacterium]
MLLSPPLAFLVLLLAALGLYWLLSPLAFKVKQAPSGLTKAYTGGEEVKTHRVRPDYSQFFPFAFFFTILHVVTLVVATVPLAAPGSVAIAVIYLGGAAFGLLLLFRRQG